MKRKNNPSPTSFPSSPPLPFPPLYSEYHLESCYFSVHHRKQLHVRWCDKMWREPHKPESLGVSKVGTSPAAPTHLLLTAIGPGERRKLPNGVWDGAPAKIELNLVSLNKKIAKFEAPWVAFLWRKLAGFWKKNFSYCISLSLARGKRTKTKTLNETNTCSQRLTFL